MLCGMQLIVVARVIMPRYCKWYWIWYQNNSESLFFLNMLLILHCELSFRRCEASKRGGDFLYTPACTNGYIKLTPFQKLSQEKKMCCPQQTTNLQKWNLKNQGLEYTQFLSDCDFFHFFEKKVENAPECGTFRCFFVAI